MNNLLILTEEATEVVEESFNLVEHLQDKTGVMLFALLAMAVVAGAVWVGKRIYRAVNKKGKKRR